VSRWLLLAVLVITVAGAVWLGARELASPIEVTLPTTAPPSGQPLPRGVVGMSGCLASACHGASAEKPLAGKFDSLTWMSSGSCWVAADPHRGTYDLLTDKPRREVTVSAATMMKRLRIDTPATEDARCLACHTNPALAEPGETSDPRVIALRREGISCEGCHGSAGGWVREHTAWNARTDHSTTGMTMLATVSDRAAACAGCHVGAPEDRPRDIPPRDMNHDMIAAGHPRLNFDYAEYLRCLPKHWRDATPPSPAREWLLGRVVHAEAACRLLADRAERATKNDARTPWPEFAEFNCAACHHKFANPDDKVARTSGALRWQTLWPVTVSPDAGRNELSALRSALTAPRAPSPAKLAEPARKAAADLESLRKALAKKSDLELESLSRELFANPLPPDTDAMGHTLHGLAALERLAPRDEALAEFDRAFERFQRRDWPALRTSLDGLLGRMKR
jgi:hypothetical protein